MLLLETCLNWGCADYTGAAQAYHRLFAQTPEPMEFVGKASSRWAIIVIFRKEIAMKPISLVVLPA